MRSVVACWLQVLHRRGGEAIDTSLYSLLLAFDNMGRVGFSKDFGALEVGEKNRMLEMLEITFRTFSKTGHMAWPFGVVMALPPMGFQKEFEALGVSLVDEREGSKATEVHDIMGYFLEDLHSDKPKSFQTRDAMYADSHAILVAAT